MERLSNAELFPALVSLNRGISETLGKNKVSLIVNPGGALQAVAIVLPQINANHIRILNHLIKQVSKFQGIPIKWIDLSTAQKFSTIPPELSGKLSKAFFASHLELLVIGEDTRLKDGAAALLEVVQMIIEVS